MHKSKEQENEIADQHLIDNISDNLPPADISVDENDPCCDSSSDKESLPISDASGNFILNELQDENLSKENCHKGSVAMSSNFLNFQSASLFCFTLFL